MKINIILIDINFMALDEFNLQCYVSMYAYILNIINNGPAALLPSN